MKPIPAEPIIEKARPVATKIAQDLVKQADEKCGEFPQGQFCGVLAHLVQQNIICNIALQQAHPGTKMGEDIIRDLYESSLKDTLEYWKSDYLKAHFGGN